MFGSIPGRHSLDTSRIHSFPSCDNQSSPFYSVETTVRELRLWGHRGCPHPSPGPITSIKWENCRRQCGNKKGLLIGISVFLSWHLFHNSIYVKSKFLALDHFDSQIGNFTWLKLVFYKSIKLWASMSFLGSSADKESACKAGDPG